jgi:hypothetical protein
MADASKVDLNHAGVEELKAIKGVGKGRAEQIVLFRKARGAFNSIESSTRCRMSATCRPRSLPRSSGRSSSGRREGASRRSRVDRRVVERQFAGRAKARTWRETRL